MPLRIKALRRTLLDHWTDEKADEAIRRQARAALDDVQLVLQLYSYPGDYVNEQPSIERMAETIEKFEEDLTGAARPKGKRQARVLLGEPIDLKLAAAGGRPLNGGPQMVEISRDGKRVYITNSLYAAWDEQFYPDGIRGWMAMADVGNDGRLRLNEDFFIEFDGLRPHQVHLEGGDASSDSYCFS